MPYLSSKYYLCSQLMFDMRLFLIFLTIFAASEIFAATPAQTLIARNGSIKGAKKIEVSGAKMVFARPVLKRYPIGAMSESVDEVYVLNLKKVSPADLNAFMNEMNKVLRSYRYYGKSDSPDGLVDVYVHMKSDDLVDELVIFNPESFVVNSLIGEFPVNELLKIDSKSDK